VEQFNVRLSAKKSAWFWKAISAALTSKHWLIIVTKVSFAQDDDMNDAFPADRTDQPFSMSILPRGARRRWSITNTH
jgi:hypothetical protein